ncbi:MAG: RNase A-like domain-containing protein [Luteimonas sp.]
MDVTSTPFTAALTDWPASADAGLRPEGAQALSREVLDSHIAARVQAGELSGFLAETDDALILAERSPVFAGELAPLLGDIRDALSALPPQSLSRVERDALEATVGRIDTWLAGIDAPDGPDGSAQVPGGGLEAHEDVGGHLIERHVGKSEQWLLDRVSRENISAASSFRDLPEAEHFVSATIADHQARVDAWADGSGGNRLVIDTTFDASTGISVSRGDTSAVDVFSVRLVLERSNQLDIGYRIVTGYPNKP